MFGKIITIIILLAVLFFGAYLFLNRVHLPDSRSSPTVTPTPTEIFSDRGNIVVTAPQPYRRVDLPLVVEGRARVFENTLSVRLRDTDGTILVEDSIMANSPDIGQFGLFRAELSYPQPKAATAAGIVEVFVYSARDGSEEEKVIIPISFQTVAATTVNVFFISSQNDPQFIHCDRTYPVERRVPQTSAVARAALEELLKGPATTEEKAGFTTAINDGVKIQKLTIENGTAKVDFNSQLGLSVAGSCRVQAIRAQITDTLKQFPTLKNVVISINGKTEGILQP